MVEYEPTNTIRIWIKAQRNGIQVDMTKNPELYTKARATPKSTRFWVNFKEIKRSLDFYP